MADSLEIQSSPEPDSKTPLLPLPKGFGLKAIETMAHRAPAAIKEEDDAIENLNPILDGKMTEYLLNNIPEVDRDHFMEGALYTYRLIRMHALKHGQQLPEVTEDDWKASEANRVEEIHDANKGNDESGELTNEDYILLEYDTLTMDDQEIGEAMKEIMKFMSNQLQFKNGVVRMYKTLKNAMETKNMEKKFGITE